MHWRVCAAILALAGCVAGQTMDVHLRDGATNSVGLDDIRKVTYDMAGTIGMVIHHVGGSTESTPISTIRKITFDITTGTRHDQRKVARLKTALMSILPNPFNRAASITYSLARREKVLIEVYNGKGERVRTIVDRRMDEGTHRTVWDARSDDGSRAVAGAYLVRVSIGNTASVRRLMMVR
jgi:hypothetical protein